MNNNKSKSFQKGGYITFLKESEMIEVFKEFLEAKGFKTTGVTSKNVIKFKNGQGTVKVERCVEPEYSDGVMRVWKDGKPWRDKAVNINEALDLASNHYRDLVADRKAAYRNTQRVHKSPEQIEKENKERAERIAESNRINAEKVFESEKSEYLFRLPGVAVAQYVYLAANARQGEEHHTNQLVKSPDKHPYVKAKGFDLDERDDILIAPQAQPTEGLLIKFIKSDKFELPENIYGLTKDDILKEIQDSKSRPNKDERFNIEFIMQKSDFNDGVAIIPSRDINGTIVNLQRLLVKEHNGTNKKFLGRALVTDGFYVFNHKHKLSPNYTPKAIIITEGWATARAIDKIVNKENDDVMVVVCWNANQIKNATAKFLNQYPDKQVFIAADNDYKSFAKAPGKDMIHVFNTGIKESLISYEHNATNQNRISIFTPTIDYTKFDPEKIISDFDDVARRFGSEYMANMLKNNMLDAIQRRKDGILESDYYSKLYNQQAQYWADIHNLPIKGIDPDGVLSKDVREYDIESTISFKFDEVAAKARLEEIEAKRQAKSNDKLSHGATNNQDNEPPAPPADNSHNDAPIVQTALSNTSLTSLFRVEVPESIKTDFERNLEREVGFITGTSIHSTRNLQVKDEPTSALPAETHQEMKANLNKEINLQSGQSAETITFIDPRFMAAMLYDQYAQNLLENATANATSVEDININPHSLPNETKILGAILDPTMGKHLGAELDRHIENYKDKPFYQDLIAIRSNISEDMVVHNAESYNLMKDFQREISTAFISKHYNLGVDEKVTDRILSSDITHRPTEEKKAFFQGLRNTFKALEINDHQWIKSVRETLETTKEAVINITKSQSNANTNSIQPNM